MHPLSIILAIALFLGTVEGFAYWWMRPAPAGLGEPVLVYRPREVNAETLKTEMLKGEAATGPDQATTQNSSSISASQPFSVSASTHTPLPEIYAKSAPMLRCSSGQVLHARIDESAGIHLAFFEWDGTDTGSVLEAFRHMPEACMGSIGMKLVSREKPIVYTVRRQATGDASRSKSLKVESRKSDSKTTRQLISSSSDLGPSDLQTFDSSASTLVFDHTVFREGGGVAALSSPIHAFRAVWVSGVSAADARKGLGGNEFDRLRTIRIESALHRFRPAHARVIQGAVRGIPDPELAWQAFQEAMLKDLSFQ